MYPKQHAVVSTVATGIYAAVTGVPPVETVLWAMIGGVAGVVIDVDHALLSMFLRHRVNQGLYWFKHPVKAVTYPERFLDDMDYDGLLYHRLLSHAVVLALLLALLPVHRLFIPITVGVATHLASDLAYDTYTGNYTEN